MDQPTTPRELDAAIARHVFGYEVEPRTNTRTGETDYVQRAPSGQDWVRVAFYSASMGAAINVDVELQKRGWKRVPMPRRLGSQWNEGDGPTVVLEHADGRVVEEFGPVNEAVCRAALKAVQTT